MKIAMVLPSLAQKGPIIVARDIIDQLKDEFHFEVFYFDDIVEIDFPCTTHRVEQDYKFVGFDIVHSHMLRPDFYNSAIKEDTRKICTLHNYMYADLSDTYGRFIGFIYEKIWCYKIQKFDKIIVLSNSMKNYYLARIPSAKIQVIYNGRPHSDIKVPNNELLKKIEEFKEDSFLIGVFCSLIYRKGIDRIIKMLAIANNFKLLVVGEGIEKKKLQKLAKKLNIEDKIYWTGFQKTPNQFYQLVDLNIMASRSEGFPLALLEMGIHKIPVACIEHEIFTELYNENELSYYKSDNPSSMLNACLRLINNKENYINSFYRKTIDNYSIEAMGNSYRKMYKSI
jgi:glycosyltransferase involved in cell wall biosynthesis